MGRSTMRIYPPLSRKGQYSMCSAPELGRGICRRPRLKQKGKRLSNIKNCFCVVKVL